MGWDVSPNLPLILKEIKALGLGNCVLFLNGLDLFWIKVLIFMSLFVLRAFWYRLDVYYICPMYLVTPIDINIYNIFTYIIKNGPPIKEGLGIQNLKSFNNALLSKWLLRYHYERGALVEIRCHLKYGNLGEDAIPTRWGGLMEWGCESILKEV